MTKREFAEEIARLIEDTNEGITANVNEVNKANGVVLMGITIKEEGNNIAPTICVDDYYDNNRNNPFGEIADDIMRQFHKGKIAQPLDMDWLRDWSKVKDRLVAGIYNKSNEDLYPLHVSASEYGFDDLIIMARIIINLPTGKVSIVVKPEIADCWGVSYDEIIKKALDNVKDDVTIRGMASVLRELMGLDEEEYIPDEVNETLVVTNKERTFGAIAVISARDQLSQKFPEGYIVIPSSVHEVLIMAYDGNINAFNQMVSEVNETEVEAQEVLSNHAYVIIP